MYGRENNKEVKMRRRKQRRIMRITAGEEPIYINTFKVIPQTKKEGVPSEPVTLELVKKDKTIIASYLFHPYESFTWRPSIHAMLVGAGQTLDFFIRAHPNVTCTIILGPYRNVLDDE